MAKAEDKSGSTGENPWLWREHRNPYLHNLFMILGLEDPRASSADFNARVSRLRGELAYNRHRDVLGYTPGDVDLAAAQVLQRDANRLSIERLLAHMVHRPEMARFDEFIEFFSAAQVADPGQGLPLAVVNVAPIARRLPAPAAVSASMLGRPDPAALLGLLAPRPEQERILPQ
jgi:hypothetical protein